MGVVYDVLFCLAMIDHPKYTLPQQLSAIVCLYGMIWALIIGPFVYVLSVGNEIVWFG